MKRLTLHILCLALVISTFPASPVLAAPGDLDTSFSPPNLNDVVWATSVQSDGNVIVGGSFTNVGDDLTLDRLIRLLPNGSLDTSFRPPESLNSRVLCIVVLSDGKILVGGGFTNVGGNANHIIRLLPNGVLDTSFTPPSDLNGEVRDIVVRPDGRILVGGFFTNVGGDVANDFVIRLLPGGAMDTDFTPATEMVNGAYSITLQPDSKILVGSGEEFSDIANPGPLFRLLPDGDLDESFSAPADLWGSGINELIVQQGGKIIVSGSIHVGSNFSGSKAYLFRLLPDGSLDEEFSHPGVFNSNQSMIQQPDGKIIVGGYLTSDFVTYHLFRMFPDGSYDNSFQLPGYITRSVQSISIQPDGNLIVGGFFDDINGDSDHNFLARIEAAEPTPLAAQPASNYAPEPDPAVVKKIAKLKKKIKAAKKKGKKAKAKKLIKALKKLT